MSRYGKTVRRGEGEQQSLQADGARQGEGTRTMGAVEHICIWETLFWFGQMWEPGEATFPDADPSDPQRGVGMHMHSEVLKHKCSTHTLARLVSSLTKPVLLHSAPSRWCEFLKPCLSLRLHFQASTSATQMAWWRPGWHADSMHCIYDAVCSAAWRSNLCTPAYACRIRYGSGSVRGQVPCISRYKPSKAGKATF